MTDTRQPRRHLWLIAQGFLSLLMNMFGAPEEIAARGALRRAEWALLSQWLRAGEALMRRLLLIEAAALPKPNARPPSRRKGARERRLMSFSAEAPESWRVSFRALPSARRPRLYPTRPRPQQRSRGALVLSAWPLAERAEALLRAFNDPAPYARRLAGRLYATPRRARLMLRHPPDAPALVGAEGFAAAHAAAVEARRVFDTS